MPRELPVRGTGALMKGDRYSDRQSRASLDLSCMEASFRVPTGLEGPKESGASSTSIAGNNSSDAGAEYRFLWAS